jgi:hypothetical protein
VQFLSRFRQPKRLPNITVYYMRAVVDGDAKASPLGIIPRFSDDYENRIRDKHHPVGTAYIHERIDGASVILFWATDRIDAVCFLSVDEARAFPALVEFPDKELDSVLNHFPR